jgi:inhibitor of Bruton tyrosine kinase
MSHRHIAFDEIKWCNEKLLLLHQGHAYLAKVHNKFEVATFKSSSDYHDTYAKKELCSTHRFRMDFKRLPYITNAVDVFSDWEGENFAVLQEYTKRDYRPPFVIVKNHDFGTLLLEANEFDNIHDVVFHVEEEIYPAHRFLVFARCPYLRQVVEAEPDKHVTVRYAGLTARFFELILRYIYTNQLITKEGGLDEGDGE